MRDKKDGLDTALALTAVIISENSSKDSKQMNEALITPSTETKPASRQAILQNTAAKLKDKFKKNFTADKTSTGEGFFEAVKEHLTTDAALRKREIKNSLEHLKENNLNKNKCAAFAKQYPQCLPFMNISHDIKKRFYELPDEKGQVTLTNALSHLVPIFVGSGPISLSESKALKEDKIHAQTLGNRDTTYNFLYTQFFTRNITTVWAIGIPEGYSTEDYIIYGDWINLGSNKHDFDNYFKEDLRTYDNSPDKIFLNSKKLDQVGQITNYELTITLQEYGKNAVRKTALVRHLPLPKNVPIVLDSKEIELLTSDIIARISPPELKRTSMASRLSGANPNGLLYHCCDGKSGSAILAKATVATLVRLMPTAAPALFPWFTSKIEDLDLPMVSDYRKYIRKGFMPLVEHLVSANNLEVALLDNICARLDKKDFLQLIESSEKHWTDIAAQIKTEYEKEALPMRLARLNQWFDLAIINFAHTAMDRLDVPYRDWGGKKLKTIHEKNKAVYESKELIITRFIEDPRNRQATRGSFYLFLLRLNASNGSVQEALKGRRHFTAKSSDDDIEKVETSRLVHEWIKRNQTGLVFDPEDLNSNEVLNSYLKTLSYS